MADDLQGLELYAYVGEDEHGSGELGLKQAQVPAGTIPLVATRREKIDQDYIREQLQAQADEWGKPIRFVRCEFAEELFALESGTPAPERPNLMLEAVTKLLANQVRWIGGAEITQEEHPRVSFALGMLVGTIARIVEVGDTPETVAYLIQEIAKVVPPDAPAVLRSIGEN